MSKVDCGPGEDELARSVADADFVRRQNRGLILSTLRREGPLSRTQLAGASGLSHASITAIGGELIAQNVLLDLGETPSDVRARGRPAIQVSFNRHICHAILIELDVNQARFSLVDYAGTLVDRTEYPVTPTLFADTPLTTFLTDGIGRIRDRNPPEFRSLRRIAISVQGILDPESNGLSWSPIAHVGGASIAGPLSSSFNVNVRLHKRGPLLAEGTRALYPQLRDMSVATVFVGSTVALGMTANGRLLGRGDEGATEFGHMNHIPDGAQCRCGMRGCLEAYAADYGVLRTAYGVPERTPPAATVPPAAYQQLVQLGQSGRRNVVHAFNVAGRAIGYSLSRLMTIAAPTHIVIVGPGASAFDLMRGEINAALAASLVCKINGSPTITVHHDEREPIFQGMLITTLSELDQGYFAALTPESRSQGVESKK
jgi:predicted NBD/HSP70 family sugar kinase